MDLAASAPSLSPRRCPRCEYNLYGLPLHSPCPECGWDPSRAALAASAPADAPRRRAARCHLAGLVLLLLAIYCGLDVVLIERSSDGLGGNLALINVPGPKFWAVGALRRTTGHYVSDFGVAGMHALILSIGALWLLTVPRPGERSHGIRLAGRCVAVACGGAAFGVGMGTSGIWSGGMTWSRLLLALTVIEVPATLLIWLRLRQLCSDLTPSSLRRNATLAAISITGLILAAVVMLLWREFGPEQRWSWDRVSVGSSIAVMCYGAAAIATAIAGVVVVVRIGMALLPVALPNALTGTRRLLGGSGGLLERLQGAISTPGLAVRAAATLALLLVLLSAHFHAYEFISRYGTRAGLGSNLPILNYPGLKVSALPSVEFISGRVNFYRRWLPPPAAHWSLVAAGAIAALAALRRDVAPRLGCVLGWGVLIGVGGITGLSIAIGEMESPRPVTLTVQAVLLVPIVELPLTFLLHRWLAALADAHGRPRAARRLRIAALLVVGLQLLAVATLLAARVTNTPLQLAEYRLSLPALAACGAYGAAALVTAVISTTALASLMLAVLSEALPKRAPLPRAAVKGFDPPSREEAPAGLTAGKPGEAAAAACVL